MPTPTEIAVRTYEAAWNEPDRAVRAQLVDACFAADGRIVSRGAVIHGRTALAEAMSDFRADPRGLTARIAGAVDAQGPIFRFHSRLEHRDGTIVQAFDAGVVDADGRIAVLIAFGGALPPP